MTRKEFPGAMDADALPGGEYVVSYLDGRNYLDTHRGRVATGPLGNLLFVRASAVHGFRFAGQAHRIPNQTPEWIDGAGWKAHAKTPHGVSPVIYDASGTLHISDGSIGSQGWRYVERGTGRLVTGDATYGPKGSMRLWEWTDLGDGLYVGQNQADAGVVLWDGKSYRLVTAGVCRFIRAHRDGDKVSIAYRRSGGPAGCLWLTVAELKASPVIATAPQPEPDDDGEPDDMTSAQYLDLRDRLKRLDGKLDQVLDALDELPTPDNPPDPGNDDPDEPPPADPEVPEIPIAAVTWLGKANPLDFKVTSHITDVSIVKKSDDGSTAYANDNFSVCFPHTKAGKWPVLTNSGGTKYEGNVCVFGRIGGRWYGDTAEWLKVNQTCKRLTNRPEHDSWGIGPHTKHEPMRSWGPKPGEWIGLMVCTPVRDGIEGPSQERSQIYMVRWP